MDKKLHATGGTDNVNVYGKKLKTHMHTGTVDKGFANEKANLLNGGKDDSVKERAARLQAMQRRMSKDHTY